uniref:Uncharacterized protein n=1 Tax=Anguilla anguilla TaxID=7936 RepID=A0A0E9PTR0_ANGAN
MMVLRFRLRSMESYTLASTGTFWPQTWFPLPGRSNLAATGSFRQSDSDSQASLKINQEMV